MHAIHYTGYLLHHVSSQIAKQTDQVLQEQLGIGLSQFKILQSIESGSQRKQRDIADYLGQTEASISRQIKLLIAEGLLHVVQNRDNHREHLPMLTPKGMRFTAAALEVLERYYAPTFVALGDKRSEQLLQALIDLHGLTCHVPHPETSV